MWTIRRNMATTLVCGRCGRIAAYLRGADAAALARCLAGVGVGVGGGGGAGPSVRCPDCAVGGKDARRARRLCKCGHPFAYHASTGELGPCIWSDWPTEEGRDLDKPIPCGCKMYDEADEAA